MNDTKYVCVRDDLNDGLLVGTLKTISAWKLWLLKTKIDDIYEVSLLYDESAIEQIEEMLKLKENEVIRYISDNFDIKLIPLENKNQKYLVEDTGKLLYETEVRQKLLLNELDDITYNSMDYVYKDLSIESQCECIKYAVNSPIEVVIKRLNEFWQVPIKKLF